MNILFPFTKFFIRDPASGNRKFKTDPSDLIRFAGSWKKEGLTNYEPKVLLQNINKE